MDDSWQYCPLCGHALSVRKQEDRARKCCPSCDRVHYRNPAVGVATVVLKTNQILLVERGEGRYRGDWCIPCGYVEWGEDIRAAAEREMLEETGLTVQAEEILAVHSNFHDPEHLTVGIWFLGTVCRGVLRPGGDAAQVRYFPLDALPKNLAFPTDRKVLELLLSKKK